MRQRPLHLPTALRAFALVALGVAVLLQLHACAHDGAPPAPAETSPLAPASSDDDRANELRREGEVIVNGAGAHPFRLRFAKGSTSIVRALDGTRMTLLPARLERPKGAKSGLRETGSTPYLRGQRVLLAAEGDAFTEWFEPRPEGLEHGFTVRRRPGGDDDGLRIDVEITGDVEVAASALDGAVDLVRRGDKAPLFRYGALVALDDDNRRLPARLTVAGPETIRIEVDDRNASYPVTIDPLVWALSSKLVRLEHEPAELLGVSVVISNGTIVAGMSGRHEGRGAAAIFHQAGSEWREEELLTFSQPDAQVWFGGYVAVDGDRVLVASDGPSTTFVRDGGRWKLEQELQPEWLPWIWRFSTPVALKGERAVISVARRVAEILPDGGILPSPEDAEPAGGIFVWERKDDRWVQTARIELPVPVQTDCEGRLALDDDALAIGTGTHVLVYRRSTDGSWNLEAALEPPDEQPEYFGYAVALHGDTLLATRPPGVRPTLFAYVRTASGWHPVQQNLFPMISPNDLFGESLVFEGDTAFVGSPGRSISGAVLRYRRTGTQWRLEEEIIPPDITTASYFGSSVGMSNGSAVFGAMGQAGGSGAVYVYALRSSLGEPCTHADSCASGFCVDGVCCDDACGGGSESDCLVCNAEKTRGLCTPAGRDVICRSQTSECDTAESCDGEGTTCPADLVLANGTPCTGGTCIGGACMPTTAGANTDAAAPSVVDAGDELPSSRTASCTMSSSSRPDDSSVYAAAGLFVVLVVLVARRRARVCGGVIAGVALVRAPGPATDTTITLSTGTLRAHVSRSGVVFADEDARSTWSLSMSAIGRKDGLVHPAPNVLPRRSPDGRVVFDRGGVLEWYEANDQGIEQGFDIASHLPGEGPLVLRLRSDPSSTDVAATKDGEIAIRAGLTRFGYGGLLAYDAEKKTLPVSMRLAGTDIEIEVDDRGAAYPIVIDPLVWRVTEPIEASPPKKLTSFGRAVAIDGDRMVAGSPNGVEGGSAAVYVRVGHRWQKEADLAPIDKLPTYSGYGSSVAISGNTIAIGAPFDGIVESGVHYPLGTVHVFERIGTVWLPTTRLILPEPQVIDLFGWSVALSGDTLVIGAVGRMGYDENFDYYGAVYVASRGVDGAWDIRAELTGNDDARYFGNSVALSGDTIVVGSAGQLFQSPTARRAAYFFRRDGERWTTEHVEYGPTGYFGDNVAIDGEAAVISAPSNLAAGLLYPMRREGGRWLLDAPLAASTGMPSDRIGAGMSLLGDRLVVGAYNADDGKGVAYLFERTNGAWRESRRFVAPDGAPDDQFGSAVAQSGDVVLIGAPERRLGRGAVYPFSLALDAEPCTNGEMCASGFCVDGYCCDTPCGDGDPNDCLACSVAAGGAKDGVCTPTRARLCRPPRDECDVGEYCDGVNTSCPADVVAENGQSCQAGAGTCSGGRCVPIVPITAGETSPASEPLATGDANAGGGCTIVRSTGHGGWALVLGACILASRRRRRRADVEERASS